MPNGFPFSQAWNHPAVAGLVGNSPKLIRSNSMVERMTSRNYCFHLHCELVDCFPSPWPRFLAQLLAADTLLSVFNIHRMLGMICPTVGSSLIWHCFNSIGRPTRLTNRLTAKKEFCCMSTQTCHSDMLDVLGNTPAIEVETSKRRTFADVKDV